MELDKDLPLYYQIKSILKQQIASGELKPGDMIPPERELALQFQVSRMTSRQAINELAREGLVKRAQGKGTFVAPVRVQKEVAKLTSFTEDMMARGMVPSSQLLSHTKERPSLSLMEKMELNEEDDVYHIVRLRHADFEPIALEHAYLQCERFPGLEGYDLETSSLYEIVQRDYRFTPAYAEQMFEVTRLSYDDAKLLRLKRGDAGLRITRTVYDLTNRPSEYAISIYHPDRYQYMVRLYP